MSSIVFGALCVLAVLVVACMGQGAAAATTTIEGTEVHWEFSDSKWNDYSWSMPVTAYENTVVTSRYLVRDKVNLDLDGETIRTVSLDGFVKGSFTNVIDDVYDNSYSNSDFIWEVWHIVSQLTVYDEDIHEYSEGRYALETFTRGGGDCEDLVILVADMLMSSRYTDDWTFEYVFMDADSPTDPQTLNHVILAIDDGEYQYYIEATAAPSWDYYPEGVSGWWFEVVPDTDVLDFTDADLSGMDLSRKDLSWAILAGTDLSGAYLRETNLHEADLSGADLSGANLARADLSGADLSLAVLFEAYAVGADLSEATLDWADLSEANLARADLSGAELFGADLTETYLRGADLSGASLWDSYVSGAMLVGADLSDVNLSYADMSGAYMYGTDLYGADLSYADLSGADMRGAFLLMANLTGADLTETDLRGAITDHTTIMP